MIIEEEARGDVEGDEDVDGVVLMRGQDEEDAEDIAEPGEEVQQKEAAGSICGGYNHIYYMVDQEDAEDIAEPGEEVQQEEAAGRICGGI